MNALAIQEVARPGSRWGKSTIKAISERFKELKDRNGGVLTAEDVLEDARDAASPLHKYFEWDDSKAADRFRLEQARSLMRSVYVIVETPGGSPSQPMQANVVVEMNGGERGYVSMVEVIQNEDYGTQIVQRARAEMQSWIDRYSRFNELRKAVTSAQMVLEKLAG